MTIAADGALSLMKPNPSVCYFTIAEPSVITAPLKLVKMYWQTIHIYKYL